MTRVGEFLPDAAIAPNVRNWVNWRHLGADCVRLFPARHPPIALGGLCVSCGEGVGDEPHMIVPCADDTPGLAHAPCAETFSRKRTARAMAALARLGVGDPAAPSVVKLELS